ncbi:site-specific DNA-methyltransferase [uncultured Sphingomonas sp.]|uniref:site-specific DNA-methyltransferase n=1 Tax=uncultured Sphingomonas sp. TaxID=158754 RepID=UPI0025FC16E8|nr:site-specific DNA-methyltransferase [uncultured Sphingomonas sp.]
MKHWPADKVERRKVSDLTPYARNSRTHSDEQVAQIAASIKEWGWTVPVLIEPDGGIIAGHGRVMAAQRLGIAEVPCMVADGWSEAQKRAYIIADNKLALNAGWDDEMLRTEFAELSDLGFDLSLTGFGDDELAALSPTPDEGLTDPDAAPDVPELPVTVEGDVWVLGPHRVVCGSSTDVEVWDRVMQGERADICWTDPPYNVAYESKAGKIKNDDMADSEFRQFLSDAFVAVSTALKPGAPIYVAHADTEGLNFRGAFTDAGFKLSGCLIWKKDSLVLGRSDYQWMHEPILYGWKPGAAHRWYGGRKLTTVVDDSGGPISVREDGSVQVKVGDEVVVITGDVKVESFLSSVIFHEKPKRSSSHPTMKPVGLIERMLRASSRAGDVVIDGFGGSGSTLIAADRMGQSARLVELDPKFVDVIVCRWQEYTGRSAVLHDDGRTFDEIAASRAA